MPEGLITQDENKVYKGLAAIGARLGISAKLALKMIRRKSDPLSAKRVGREYWITERMIIKWLNDY